MCRCAGTGRAAVAFDLLTKAARAGAADPFEGRFGDPDAWRGVPCWHVAPERLAPLIESDGALRVGRGETNGAWDGNVWGDGIYCAIGEDSAALYEGPGTRRFAAEVDLDQPLFYDLPPPDRKKVRDNQALIIAAVDQLRGPLPESVQHHYDRLAEQSWVDADWLALNRWRAGYDRHQEILSGLRAQRRPDTGVEREQVARDGTRAYLIELGYDGLVLREAVPSRIHGGGNQVLVFDPANVTLLSRR